jgi:MSHA biogenesis protein MshQ
MIKTMLRGLSLLALLGSANALAVTYTFNTDGTPLVSGGGSICSGAWSRSGTTFTCDGVLTTASGDVLTVSTATTISVAARSHTLIATLVGAADRNINLTATSNPFSASNSTINGTVTATSGDISLTGGSVTGQVLSNCCNVTTNGTNLQGGARSNSSGISITGGTIQGEFFAANNTATFSGVTMIAGRISGASTVSISDSSLGSLNTLVSVSSVSGAITLNNTNAYGNFNAPSYSFIDVNSLSTVTGTCLPRSDPPNACSSGPLLSWSLDEAMWSGASGVVKDSTPNGLDGTALNGAVTANTGPALPEVNAMGTCGYGSFSSSASQYVQRADNNLLDLQGSFTIGLWVKPRRLPSSGLMTLVSKDENYEFHLNPNGTVNWWWQTSSPTNTREFNSTAALTAGQWSHVLVRYAPGDQRIYINGSLAGQANFDGTPQANSDPLQLGADQNTGGRYFDGDMDELRIYNTALSPAQISALYQERHQCALRLQCFSDSFDNPTLGTDWAVASRGNTAFTPTVINQRMRLTSNQGQVSTASTLQRLFPAAGNFIQVGFKHYAYGGSGADGIAVVLSDATVAPQPGAFGGPLGYGTRGDAANPGFAGGWLGIGIDEFGNFSTEGGPGGPERRLDSVSVRGSGSGSTGYRYIAGTPANLSPEIDQPGSAAGPGHTYRISIDGRFTSQALVTVERDSGSGFVVLPNLNAVNVLAAANSQAALPAEFYLSLTGSTGGSTNFHELDDLQICASTIKPLAQQIDHFEFSYAGTALTCSPQPVTIRACLNSSCSTLFTDPVSVTLNPASYWSAVAPATGSGNVINFSGGTAQARLSITTPSTVSLGVQTSTPSTKPLSVPICSTTGCGITYADSGLLLQVPNMLAAKPTAATISAVRKSDNALQCVPAFANVSRNVGFTSAYTNPSTGTQPVVVNGSTVRGTAVSVNLNFDASGTAPLTVRYDDAGQMTLNASYAGSSATADPGLTLTGSDLFVSKPYGLCLQTDSTCASADENCAVLPGVRAGDSFPLRVRAVGWQADGEALTAVQLCTGNITTPNFIHSSILLSSAVQAPVGGANGTMSPTTYAHALGSQTTSNTSISEVGVFTITAMPPAGGYLDGETVSGGSSALAGRFIPAYLGAVGSASLTPSCGSAFSYQGQPMVFASTRPPSLVITGFNRAGGVTTNYDRGAFWKLATPAVGSYSSVTLKAALDARLASQGVVTPSTTGAGDGDGRRTFSWSGEQLLYQQAALPSDDDYPFLAKARQGFTAAVLTDVDGACHGSGSGCIDYSYDFSDEPGSEVRLGRLRIGNAYGSELQSLGLPLMLESWQSIAGGSFQAEGLDTCTTSSVLGTPELFNYLGNLSANETTPSLTVPVAGVGRVQLSAPGNGNDGSVQVRFASAPSWLHYPWNGAARQAAVGLASFGIYKGSPPLIFRREMYR